MSEVNRLNEEKRQKVGTEDEEEVNDKGISSRS
jgi:hypothetical protein